jgi:RNase adaptor protein for sRNA GlmZ degradation
MKPTMGAAFVFDMRGILNPGRFEEFKRLSGLDKSVRDFLEQRTRMPEFLNGIYNVIDITVEDYIRRNFQKPGDQPGLYRWPAPQRVCC